MDDKLRKKILKELNYLLEDEGPERVEVGGSSTRNTGTTFGIGAAAGAATAGTLMATGVIGASTIGTAVGIGAAAGSVVPVVGTIVGVVVGALVGLGIAAIFRTAGYQEVKQDIKDAFASNDIVTTGEVASKLHTGAYIDLTTMKDSTDLDDMKSFIAAMKAVAKRFDEPRDEKEYLDLYRQLSAEKDFYKKICDVGYVLLNEFGANDRIYYFKCGKLVFKNIPPQIKQEPVKEAVETSATSAPPAGTIKKEEPKKEVPKCTNLDTIVIPLDIIKLATENEIEDSEVKVQNPVPEEIKAESPFTAQICGSAEKPGLKPEPGPSPKPNIIGGGEKKKCVRCVNVKKGCSGKQVEEIQARLNELGIKVSERGTFGEETYNAVISFQTSKGLKKIDGIVGPETCLAMGLTGSSATTKPSATSKFVDVNVKPQDLINLGFTGRFVKLDPAVSDSEMQKVSVDPEILTVLEKGKDYQPLEESKNFYDNIKLKQARLLYEKLIRKL